MALTLKLNRTGRAARKEWVEAPYTLTLAERAATLLELVTTEVRCAYSFRHSHPEWARVHVQVGKKFRRELHQIAAAYGLAAGERVRQEAARSCLLREWDAEARDLGRHTIISGGEVMEV